MKLQEYLEREPSGMAFIEIVMYLGSRDKKKPPLSGNVLKLVQHDFIQKYDGDVSGLEDTLDGFRKDVDDDDVSI